MMEIKKLSNRCIFNLGYNFALIRELEKIYGYNEKIENNRIILLNNDIKLVEIKDTKTDRELYKKTINDYLHYIKDNYVKSSIFCEDLNYSFDKEVLSSQNKLPLFFVYVKNKFIGVAGYTKAILIEKNNEEIIFQELCLRFATLRKNASSVCKSGLKAFLMVYLYALYNNANLIYFTFLFHRDLMFHLSDIIEQYYVCSSNEESRPFIKNVGTLDVFINKKEYIEVVKKFVLGK